MENKKVEVGDTVYVYYRERVNCIGTVTRVTGAYAFIVASGISMFERKYKSSPDEHGRLMQVKPSCSDHIYTTYIETDALKLEYKRLIQRNDLIKYDWSKIKPEVLDSICALLEI